jgi:hypothetical protein
MLHGLWLEELWLEDYECPLPSNEDVTPTEVELVPTTGESD